MTKRRRIAPRRAIWLTAPLSALLLLTGCPNKKEAAAAKAQPATGTSAAPDKVLYDRALDDMKHNRYDEARLALQTLINTYPDSEYLAKAKLATGDSYFRQGGTTGYTQAIAEYQDFITFFPFLDEAAYAQMQIAMAHYKSMEKPDRDRNEALEAEGAFQTFLEKYPNSPLFAQGQQRLRDVQEVLAQGDYAVARFYYLRHADRASAARLTDLVNRYPLFSEADHANWMLASIYQRDEHTDVAGQIYARIVKDYPLSPLAADAKDALVKLGQPVPPADPTATARMQAEQQIPRLRERGGILSRSEGALRTAPDVSMAARVGTPTMTPEDTPSGDTLNPGGSLAVGIANAGNGTGTASASRATSGTSAVVETVVPGSATSTGSTAADPAPAVDPAPAPAAALAPDVTATVATPDSGASSGSNVPAAAPASAPSTTVAAASGDAPAANTSTATTAQNTTPASSDSSKKQSSSKKKKGLKKLIPF